MLEYESDLPRVVVAVEVAVAVRWWTRGLSVVEVSAGWLRMLEGLEA
jgi:hypothetical protein